MNSESNKTEILESILRDAAGESDSANLRRAVIAELCDDGDVTVADVSHPDIELRCEMLHTGGPLPRFEVGMPVLVWCISVEDRRGIILGRVGKYAPADPSHHEDHLTIEANETLRLKCGDSSVDLRKDGKVMIRGKDVLTRAKRTNRIKGGSVDIN